MKKLMALILALSLLCLLPCALAEKEEAEHEVYTCGDWIYQLREDGTAEVLTYLPEDAESVTIPCI